MKRNKKKFEKKLEKIYVLNKKNPKKKNNNLTKILLDPDLLFTVYESYQRNRRILIKGVHFKNTINYFNHMLIKIRNERYKWKSVKQLEISKSGEKKFLRVLTLSDKLIQKAVIIVLTTIYEPVFQAIEVNHSFRLKKSAHTAVNKVVIGSFGMSYALGGKIVAAYNLLKHKKLINFLTKKILDKKLLKLIKNWLKHSIYFRKKVRSCLAGISQRLICSPILFNVYMHEFDIQITRLKKRLEERNKQKKRKKQLCFKVYDYTKYEIRKKKNKSIEIISFKNFNKKMFIETSKEVKKEKKRLIKLLYGNKIRMYHKIIYCRYADD